MKHPFTLLVLLCLLTKISFAYPPMEPLSLKERVEMADQVFIGVVEKVIAVDEDYHEIEDDNLIPDISDSVLLQVRVEESLSSPGWRPAKPVIAGFGGVWTSVKGMREKQIGLRSIYITKTVNRSPWGPVLIPSYGYFLTEPVESKTEIQKLLKTDSTSAENWTHFDKLAQYLREAESIQAGMTREKVEKSLSSSQQMDGTKERYVFNRCPYIALDIEFTRRLTTRTDGLDTVVSVSRPYLEWPKP